MHHMFGHITRGDYFVRCNICGNKKSRGHVTDFNDPGKHPCNKKTRDQWRLERHTIRREACFASLGDSLDMPLERVLDYYHGWCEKHG